MVKLSRFLHFGLNIIILREDNIICISLINTTMSLNLIRNAKVQHLKKLYWNLTHNHIIEVLMVNI